MKVSDLQVELPPEIRALIAAERLGLSSAADVQFAIRARLAATVAGLPLGERRRLLRNLAALVVSRARLPTALVLGACLVVVAMYWTNDDMGGDSRSPRGDGRYRPVLARGDGHMLYLMALSTALDGDWVFDDQLARFGDPWNEPRTRTGRKSIVHPIGPALVWTPMIWIAHAGAKIANQFGRQIPRHGYTPWHQRFVFLSSALFACGAVLLGRRLALKAIGGTWAASYAATAVLLGTSLTYYATHMPSYAHAMDAFACAAFLAYWASTIGRHDRRRWCVLGVLLGVAGLIRVQELAMGIVIISEVGARLWGSRRTSILLATKKWVVGGAIVLAVALVVFIPQLVEWHIVFGRIDEIPQGSKFTRFAAPMVAETLFSARNGWFSTTPIAYAAVLGLLLLPSRSRLIGLGLLAAVATQVYLNSTILDWWGGAAFGQRRLCSVTLPLVVGLAALLWRCGRLVARLRIVTHLLVIAVFGSLIAWNLRQVDLLGAGKPAPESLAPSCCGRVPTPLRGAARCLYRRIGNPFQFPANAIFALRHDVHLSRWDITVGNYPLIPSLADLRDPSSLTRVRGVWRIGSQGLQPYLVGGWSAPRNTDRPHRITTSPSATVLVPNLMPDAQQLTLWLAPAGSTHAVVRWNGEVMADLELLSGWRPVTIVLPAIELYTNELTIDAPGGIAVSDLEVAITR